MSTVPVNILDAIDPQSAAVAERGGEASANRALQQQQQDQEQKQHAIDTLVQVLGQVSQQKHERAMQTEKIGAEERMSQADRDAMNQRHQQELAQRKAESDAQMALEQKKQQWQQIYNSTLLELNAIGNGNSVLGADGGDVGGGGGGVLGGGVAPEEHLAPGAGVLAPTSELRTLDDGKNGLEVVRIARDASAKTAAAVMMSELQSKYEKQLAGITPNLQQVRQLRNDDLSKVFDPAASVAALKEAVAKRVAPAAEASIRSLTDKNPSTNLGRSGAALAEERNTVAPFSSDIGDVAARFGRATVGAPDVMTEEGHGVAAASLTYPFLRDFADGLVKTDPEAPHDNDIRISLSNKLGDVLVDTAKLATLNRPGAGQGPAGYKEGIIKRIQQNTKDLEADGVSKFEIQAALESLTENEQTKKALEGKYDTYLAKLMPYMHDQLSGLEATYRNVVGDAKENHYEALGKHLATFAALQDGASSPEEVATWIQKQNFAPTVQKHLLAQNAEYFGMGVVKKEKEVRSARDKAEEGAIKAEGEALQAKTTATSAAAERRVQNIANARKKIDAALAKFRMQSEALNGPAAPTMSGPSPGGF